MIQGKCLKINVYDENRYGQNVVDVYYNDIFIHEQLLKRDCVWHYVAYDRRQEFAKFHHIYFSSGKRKHVMLIEACGLYQILRNHRNGGKIIPIHMNTEEKPLFFSQMRIQTFVQNNLLVDEQCVPIRRRGQTTCVDIQNMTPGTCVHIEVNENNMPSNISKSILLGSYLGVIARNPVLAPISFPYWINKGTEPFKKRMLAEVEVRENLNKF
ncbi:hypothetical protein IEQ34_002954 [Dendrobium chrysotoxum]|uniref:Uncharacterized protein n=1 Tax=Dendrobium chrysotoxum TaxID=161865 RepID=A0AAV7HFZ3_DENCH|nr:hypothetical protein IEQ34_002954 [Dendrobium chrysotoxum]